MIRRLVFAFVLAATASASAFAMYPTTDPLGCVSRCLMTGGEAGFCGYICEPE